MCSPILLLPFVYFIPLAQASPILSRDAPDCSPASWFDILLFFLTNYVTHAFTLQTTPGENPGPNIAWAFFSLFTPYVGALKGFMATADSAILGKDILEQASRAGALLLVARTEQWTPRPGETVRYCRIRGRRPKVGEYVKCSVKPLSGEEKWSPTNRGSVQIHGQFRLPKGYQFCLIQGRLKVERKYESDKVDLASSYSFVQAISAITQLLFASITLFTSLGNQVSRYGYAAYTLTVLPYAFTSLLNLISALVTPGFSHCYVVRSEILREAIARGGRFDGTVGELSVPDEIVQNRQHADIQIHGVDEWGRISYSAPPEVKYKNSGDPSIQYDRIGNHVPIPIRAKSLEAVFYLLAWILFFGAIAGPYIIIAALTNFNKQQSTITQRVWIMLWLVFGQIAGFLLLIINGVVFNHQLGTAGVTGKRRVIPVLFVNFISMVLCIIPGIGGYIVVARQIKENGLCTSG